jgi:hypothetical protein
MRASILIVVAVVFLPAPAMAYIDPASGSAIMSAIIGFLIAVALVIKSYWYKIKSLFTKQTSGQDEPDS